MNTIFKMRYLEHSYSDVPQVAYLDQKMRYVFFLESAFVVDDYAAIRHLQQKKRYRINTLRTVADPSKPSKSKMLDILRTRVSTTEYYLVT